MLFCVFSTVWKLEEEKGRGSNSGCGVEEGKPSRAFALEPEDLLKRKESRSRLKGRVFFLYQSRFASIEAGKIYCRKEVVTLNTFGGPFVGGRLVLVGSQGGGSVVKFW